MRPREYLLQAGQEDQQARATGGGRKGATHIPRSPGSARHYSCIAFIKRCMRATASAGPTCATRRAFLASRSRCPKGEGERWLCGQRRWLNRTPFSLSLADQCDSSGQQSVKVRDRVCVFLPSLVHGLGGSSRILPFGGSAPVTFASRAWRAGGLALRFHMHDIPQVVSTPSKSAQPKHAPLGWLGQAKDGKADSLAPGGRLHEPICLRPSQGE